MKEARWKHSRRSLHIVPVRKIDENIFQGRDNQFVRLARAVWQLIEEIRAVHLVSIIHPGLLGTEAGEAVTRSWACCGVCVRRRGASGRGLSPSRGACSGNEKPGLLVHSDLPPRAPHSQRLPARHWQRQHAVFVTTNSSSRDFSRERGICDCRRRTDESLFCSAAWIWWRKSVGCRRS